ncbi:MAG: hypothetical protein FDZ72_06120 [Betaproteobacteria bacterium]|nr:MAG: hypothetical protein FDZ72_06120 [Betaproteobacteria bacterium]
MNRPSLHKQLMFAPTVVGTSLFVMAALNIDGVMNFIGYFALLFVTAIPFQYSYRSLFPIEPKRLSEAKILSSALLIGGQIVFWVSLFALASNMASRHGA